MKLLSRTKFIGPIGLVLATTATVAGAVAPEGASAAQAPAVCPGVGETEAARGETATTEEQAPASEPRREPYGPVRLVGDALSEICLSDEQRAAVEKLGERVSGEEEAVADARRSLHSALAHQLREGEIDERAVGREIDSLVKAREAASPVLREALSDLHGILDPGQRVALADALQNRMKEHAQASAGWFDALAEDLHLSDDQQKRIREVLDNAAPQLKMERAKAAAIFDEFKKDEFAMERIAPIGDVGERTRRRAEGMIGIAKELAAILTPEQRAELAARIEGRIERSMAKAAVEAESSDTGEEEPRGEARQSIVVARGGGYRAGGVRGWGGGYRGGYVAGGGYAARGAVVRTGYAAGYPLAVGYTPGVW